MPVTEQNLLTVMQWLTDNVPGADKVTEDLAGLAFSGDQEWADHMDRAADYAEAISAWFTGSTETTFAELTVPGSDPAQFIGWITPILAEWLAPATQAESDQNGRYSEPTWNDGYGLSCRYDNWSKVYEWYDEQAGTWNSQEWADQYVAARPASAADAQAEAAGAESWTPPAGAWNEDWQMFYRVGASGGYEYADAIVPGDPGSGCSEAWLTYEQVAARGAQPTAAPAASAEAMAAQAPGAGADLQRVPKQAVESDAPLAQDPQLVEDAVTEILSNDDMLNEIAADAEISIDELKEYAEDPEFQQMVREEIASLAGE